MAATPRPHPDPARIRENVRDTYDTVARDPSSVVHFNLGGAYATTVLGYDPVEVGAVPADSADRFAGVGNPHAAGPMHPGETVLDLGCGAGMDLLLAARRVAPTGRAIGVDMTHRMRATTLASAKAMGLDGIVDVRAGYIEDLPVPDASVDVVISNGVINLSPDKPAVFREIARVLKPGGRLYLADVVVAREIRADTRDNAQLWAACIAGAVPVFEIPRLAEIAGLRDCRLVSTHDAYRGTSAAEKVSSDLDVKGATFVAYR